jgi:hypothetical protein
MLIFASPFRTSTSANHSLLPLSSPTSFQSSRLMAAHRFFTSTAYLSWVLHLLSTSHQTTHSPWRSQLIIASFLVIFFLFLFLLSQRRAFHRVLTHSPFDTSRFPSRSHTSIIWLIIHTYTHPQTGKTTDLFSCSLLHSCFQPVSRVCDVKMGVWTQQPPSSSRPRHVLSLPFMGTGLLWFGA